MATLKASLRRLEGAQKPQPGELPLVVCWPEKPEEQARAAAQIEACERAGQRCVVVLPEEDAIDKLVELFL
jgi:hypothetical protein